MGAIGFAGVSFLELSLALCSLASVSKAWGAAEIGMLQWKTLCRPVSRHYVTGTKRSPNRIYAKTGNGYNPIVPRSPGGTRERRRSIRETGSRLTPHKCILLKGAITIFSCEFAYYRQYIVQLERARMGVVTKVYRYTYAFEAQSETTVETHVNRI